ncbi:hypothetical protein GCM10023094_11670 [Rhodococcus olei]|uniref:Methyltransferase family protein n=1 Tax=Rhodococcus olei TaxID=2161675 RepID=A0ABP8NVK4_9NOCA
MSDHLINHILAGTAHVLRDPRVELVLDRLYYEAQIKAEEAKELLRAAPEGRADVDEDAVLTDFGFHLRPQQGELLYLMARNARAERVVEFSTSGGAAAIYLAAAMRDNGGGMVIGSDPRPDRIEMAAANLTKAGLADYVDLRVGEPADVLAAQEGPVDLVFCDGWPKVSAPSRALRTLMALEPHLRPGALVINDNAEPDFVDYVRSPQGGYRCSASILGLIAARD